MQDKDEVATAHDRSGSRRRGMEPKPTGWASEYGAWFGEQSAAERYHLRPEYPAEALELLVSLITDEPRSVLDAGCGPGDLARPLAPLVDRVDAVDSSRAMLAKARTQPGAQAPNLRWLEGRIEEVPLDPPYALIVCGESIHWFDWSQALPRFAEMLSPHGMLAIVYRDWIRADSVRDQLRKVYSRHGANPDYKPLDPVVELERGGLFTRIGTHTTAPQPWSPTLNEFIDCHHSQCSFILEKMRDPQAFESELADVAKDLLVGADGRYLLDVVAEIAWGRPGACPGKTDPAIRDFGTPPGARDSTSATDPQSTLNQTPRLRQGRAEPSPHTHPRSRFGLGT
jgi:SAM-dependent methyltransferase